MAITRCHLCEAEQIDSSQRHPADYEAGIFCPICQRPTCRRHLTVVRWRWRNATRETDSAQICHACKREYRHRDWDVLSREWIT